MMFDDRRDAGRQLAKKLSAYKEKKEVIVIGLPRGGVIVADEIAQTLNLPLDIVAPRKIGMPDQPEMALGAISQEGERALDEKTIRMYGVSKKYIDQEVALQSAEAERRLTVYRGNRPPINLHNKIVLLVDDGIATGATMRAAIKTVQEQGAQKIVVVVPVSPPDTLSILEKEVDDVICLDAPVGFSAISVFYKEFAQTSDDEVVAIMKSHQ